MSTRFPKDLEARLRAVAPGGIEFSSETDQHGVLTAWVGLADVADLKPIGEVMHELGARLGMTTCTQPSVPEEEEEEVEEAEGEEGAEAKEPEPKEVPKTFGGTPLDGTSYEVDYHFDLGGDTLTVIAYVPQGGSIASLTPLFRNADWHEREMMELYSSWSRIIPIRAGCSSTPRSTAPCWSGWCRSRRWSTRPAPRRCGTRSSPTRMVQHEHAHARRS